jgi:hypothetical protein
VVLAPVVRLLARSCTLNCPVMFVFGAMFAFRHEVSFPDAGYQIPVTLYSHDHESMFVSDIVPEIVIVPL